MLDYKIELINQLVFFKNFEMRSLEYDLRKLKLIIKVFSFFSNVCYIN
jgi:hypothetical protein